MTADTDLRGPGLGRENRLAQRMAQLYAEDREFRDAKALDAVTASARTCGLRLAQIVAAVMQGYRDRAALGERAYELRPDPETGRRTIEYLSRFDTITYGELWDRAVAVATRWHRDTAHPVTAGDFVCVLGFTSIDYTVIDLATLYLGAVSVPLQTSAPVAHLAAATAETKPRVLATSIDFLDRAVDIALAGTAPDSLLVFGYEPLDDEQRERFESARSRLAAGAPGMTFESLRVALDVGRGLSRAPMQVPESDDALSLLLYTSGSTGTPKGAMCTERTLTGSWLNPSPLPLISLHYLPMSHSYGRNAVTSTLASGGIGYFAAKSDMSTLFDDLALVRPTALNLVPRVCELLYHSYLSQLDRQHPNGLEDERVQREVQATLRQNLLGGRLLSATCASAPLAAEMKAFVEACLDLDLRIVYGSTETGGVVINQLVQRPPVIAYKLVDVPELGYYHTDRPHPRGELLVKTSALMHGYYNRPDLTAEMFDDDGFYRTGDIMAEVGLDRLTYVDRRNNVVKLSQGEFVAISHLESVFSASPVISQIYVYASSQQAFVLAVIVPESDVTGGHDAVKALLTEALHEVAGEANLQSYEVPRDFVIETDPFSLENGLLTAVGKFARPALNERYGARLEEMYAAIADGQAEELRQLLSEGIDRPVLDTLFLAAAATLGIPAADLSADARFIDLGGDSLSALSFSKLLRGAFDIEVPVGVVTGPTADLRHLAAYIERKRASSLAAVTVESVHGHGSALAHASDLTLDKFLDAEILKTAKALPLPTGAPRTVLLTGANGFLGRFLCLEWAERLAESGGTLICLTRGGSAEASRRRIYGALSGDAGLAQRFAELAERHLEVIAGDIGEKNLGLDEPTWNRLADTVDLIVHPAALVNHRLPYDQMFGPNVVGTAELIRLALTTKLKAFNYISTVAVAMPADRPPLGEDSDIRLASPQLPIAEAHLNGYATSKWAGEVLLREANDLCGLPVVVFRPGLMMAHSRWSQQLNVPDVLTRLILSIVATGIAPRSFYAAPEGSARGRAHFDGLPVDFAAEAIASLGGQATDGFQTFNVVNPHDDDISLDQFIDWLVEAGHAIRRIDDYDDWLARLEIAMRDLPKEQRQLSLLALMEAYRQPAPAIAGSDIPCEAFRAGVRAARLGPDADIPRLSAALINKYVSDLRQLGLL